MNKVTVNPKAALALTALIAIVSLGIRLAWVLSI